MSKYEYERNKAIYNDYKSGTSMIDMVAKYRLTSTRLYAIIKRYEEKDSEGELV